MERDKESKCFEYNKSDYWAVDCEAIWRKYQKWIQWLVQTTNWSR